MIEGRVLLACIYGEKEDHITKNDLRKMFEPWGNLVCIEIAKPDPLNFRALICFEDADTAENVLANQRAIESEFGRVKLYRSNKKYLYHTGIPKTSASQLDDLAKNKLTIQIPKRRNPSLSEETRDSESPTEKAKPWSSTGSFDNFLTPFSYKLASFPEVIHDCSFPHNNSKNMICVTGFKDSCFGPKNFCRLFSGFGKVSQLLVDCRMGFVLVKFADSTVNEVVRKVMSHISLIGIRLLAQMTPYTHVDCSSLPNNNSVVYLDGNFQWPERSGSASGSGEAPIASHVLLVENLDSAITPKHFFRILSRVHEPKKFLILKKNFEEECQKIAVECSSLAGAFEIVATFNGEELAHSRLRISFLDPIIEASA